MKDEIKKGSFRLDLGVSSSLSHNKAVFDDMIKITDNGAANSYKINSPVGEYGILIADTTRKRRC